MLSLPSNVFSHALLFTSPKDVFSSKGVCKRFLNECSRPSLWKRIHQIKLPNVPIYESYENAVRQIVKPCEKVYPPLEQFEFVLNIIIDDTIVSTHHWQKGTTPLETEIKSMYVKSRLASMTDNEANRSRCELYVIFHTETKQYRKLTVDHSDTYQKVISFCASVGNQGLIDILIFHEDGKTKFDVSLYNEYWDVDTISIDEPDFAKRLFQALEFDF